MPLRLLFSALLALLTLAPAAQAAWFAAEPVDGASPDIVALGGVDLSRDATGGLVYLKRENGVPHVFLSRHYFGVWRTPERVDVGIEAAASQPVIAAGDDHRLAIAWVADGKLHGSVALGGPPQALPAPQLIHGEGPVSDPDVDLGINGTAYVVYAAPGAGGTDVRAARMQGTAWEPVAAALDISPDQAAGAGSSRARVAVSAEGNAVAAWGEEHPDGRNRVYGRRITGLELSVAPQEISLGEFEGGAGGDADSVDIDIEEDGSFAWIVLRQDFAGRSRAIARRLVGSLFEPATSIDGGTHAALPRFAMSGRGVGVAAVGAADSHAVQAALLERDIFMQSLRIDSTGSEIAPIPAVGASERNEQAVAWRSGSVLVSEVRGRHRPEESAYDAEAVISRPEFGPVGETLEVSESRAGDFVVAFLQGGLEGRRLVVATYDEPPGLPQGLSTSKYQRRKRPRLKWRPGSELMGPQLFRVLVDGAEVGRTGRSSFVVPTPLEDGPHTWQVFATDRRGQEKPMARRTIRVDSTPPDVRVRVSGKRKRGQTLKVRVSADDADGTGIKYVQVTFGDGSAPVLGTRFVKRYARSGKFSLVAKAVDKAGNVARRTVRLRIRR